jgi:hypothetical protein
MLVVGIVLALCGCGDSVTSRSNVPAEKDSITVERGSGGFTATNPSALRAYLRAWEASWSRWVGDLQSDGDEDVNLSATPDASWPRAQRVYGDAATAYQRRERRLTAIPTPMAMQAANEAYIDAVRRQVARLQEVSDAYGGTDPYALNRALQAVGQSNMEFDQDGARWERAVIAAWRASGVKIPKIVRKQFISNGHRTAKARVPLVEGLG